MSAVADSAGSSWVAPVSSGVCLSALGVGTGLCLVGSVLVVVSGTVGRAVSVGTGTGSEWVRGVAVVVEYVAYGTERLHCG